MKQRLYFDGIPCEALLNIVRYLAERPYTERWLSTIKGKDALAVLESGGVLRTAARELFTAIGFSYFDRIDHGFCTNLLVICQPVLYDKLLNALAPYLTYFQFADSRSWLSCNQFHQLRVLVVGHTSEAETVDLVLGVCSSTLRELYVTKSNLEKGLVLSITHHCKALTKLHLDYRYCSHPLQEMWIALAATLTMVSCSTSAREYTEIARHCKKLKKLELLNFHENYKENFEAFAFLLNPCVLVLCFDLCQDEDEDEVPMLISFERLSSILKDFSSSVTIHTRLLNGMLYQVAPFLRACGSATRVLTLYCRGQVLPPEFSERSMENIEDLQLISSFGIDAGIVVESIFAKPLLKLRKLRINTTINCRKLLFNLSNSTSFLEELECHTLELDYTLESLPIRAQDFTTFLQNNKKLRRIKLEVPDSFYRSDDRIARTLEIVTLLRELRNCAALENVHITDYKIYVGSKELNNACVLLRRRRINVVVNNVRF